MVGPNRSPMPTILPPPTIVHTHAARCLVPLTLLVYLQCVPYFVSCMQLCCCPSYRAETSSIPHATGDMAGPLKCNPRCSTMSAISFNANLRHRSRNDLDCPQRSRITPSRCSYSHIMKRHLPLAGPLQRTPILHLVEK